MTTKREGSSFYEAKQKVGILDKFAVCLLANCLLVEGDSIIIDAGTSLTPLADVIRIRAETNADETHYSIMTHNREAFDTLIKAQSKARFNIFHTGGRYDEDLNASFGWLAEYAYQNFHAKWVFLGQAGIVAHEGLFCHGNTEELSLKRILFGKPGYIRVILSDNSKLGVPAGLCFGSSDKFIDNVDYCILLTTVPKNGEGREKFDREVATIETTYKVKVIRVEYNSDSDGMISLEKIEDINKELKNILVREIKSATLNYTTKKIENKSKMIIEKINIETTNVHR